METKQYKGMKIRYNAKGDFYFVTLGENFSNLTAPTIEGIKSKIDYHIAMNRPRFSGELQSLISKLQSNLYLNFFDSISNGHSIVRNDTHESVVFNWVVLLNSAQSTDIDNRVYNWLKDTGVESVCSLKRCGRGLKVYVEIAIDELKYYRGVNDENKIYIL